MHNRVLVGLKVDAGRITVATGGVVYRITPQWGLLPKTGTHRNAQHRLGHLKA